MSEVPLYGELCGKTGSEFCFLSEPLLDGSQVAAWSFGVHLSSSSVLKASLELSDTQFYEP